MLNKKTVGILVVLISILCASYVWVKGDSLILPIQKSESLASVIPNDYDMLYI